MKIQQIGMIKTSLKKILTTIDNNKFNHKYKIGKLKFNDINNLISNIKNNTISERDAKEKLNALDVIRKVETKSKRLISSQTVLLNLFDDLLNTVFNNDDDDDDDDDDDNESVNHNESVNESENKNKNVNDYESHKIRQINKWFKTIGKTKSFEELIEILKTINFLDEY